MLEKGNVFAIKDDKKLMERAKNYFIGQVMIQDISKIIQSKEEKLYYVTFIKGAKTKLHHHEAGQILIPTGGKGVLAIYKKIRQNHSGIKIKKIERISLAKGDAVYIPAGKLHWHGASSKKNLSHIAINAKLPGYKEAKTVWYESDFETFANKIK